MSEHDVQHQPEKGSKADRLAGEISTFFASGESYYRRRFQAIETRGWLGGGWNWSAAIGGPLWAAGRGVWTQFWLALILETICLVLICRSFLVTDGPGGDMFVFWLAVLAVFFGRVVQGLSANWCLRRAFERWRHGRGKSAVLVPSRTMGGGALFATFVVTAIYRYGIVEAPAFLIKFPAPRTIQRSSSKAIDAVVDWMVINFEAFFNAVTLGLRHVLNFLEAVFIGTPWPLMAVLIISAAWRVGSVKLAVFSVLSLAYLGLFGYWEKSMSTMSLVAASALFCIIIGMPIGIWCGKDARVYAFVKPILDFMQTMPSFVYLIPAVAFFSIGKPPGVFATVIFAMPPMIRLSALGIAQVPGDVKEAALAFGASPWQLLVKVELPLSIPSLMAGANQTVMMSLSMVIVASMIGAGGLGYDVLKALRLLNTGEGMLAGTAIVLCAMVLDRIVQGLADQRRR
jgi:glycine betaine/proline transport system permease protein